MKIENPCQTTKPGKPIIQPHALVESPVTNPANNPNSNSPAKILP